METYIGPLRLIGGESLYQIIISLQLDKLKSWSVISIQPAITSICKVFVFLSENAATGRGLRVSWGIESQVWSIGIWLSRSILLCLLSTESCWGLHGEHHLVDLGLGLSHLRPPDDFLTFTAAYTTNICIAWLRLFPKSHQPWVVAFLYSYGY
jgi:hypothetical protein